MHAFITNHFELVLGVLILISRLGDIGSTYLVTPKLKLEANPIMRRFGWPFALLTLLVCLTPYYSTAIGIVVLVPSLMVSAANTAKIWFARAYGEGEFRELLLQMAGRGRLSHALAGTLVSAAFIALVGLVMLFLCPDPGTNWGYWFGAGFLVYAFAIAVHGSLFFIRLFKLARRAGEKNGSPASPPSPNSGCATRW